jgi:hypothetical protein
MLAYVFWHRPADGVDIGEYEDAQRAFHASLQAPSACFRVAELPFGGREAGYEDWYLAGDWQALGELNEAAVDSLRGPHHDRAAAGSADGWGAVLSLVRGTPVIPGGTEWFDKRRGEPSAEFIASLPHESVWRRQLVLGPAPEFCAATPGSAARERI